MALALSLSLSLSAFFTIFAARGGVSLVCAVRPLAVVVRWALAGSQRPQWAAVPPEVSPARMSHLIVFS